MEWKTESLGTIAFMTSGGTPSSKIPAYYENGTIPWVRSGELENGAIRDTEIKITQAGLNNSSAKIFPKGTLLIALYGATIGKLAYLDIDACTNQAVCGIFANEKVSLKYLYYFLLFRRTDLVKQGIGGAQSNISQTILKKLMVSYPVDKIEQLRIVSRIEELFSQLDSGVETLKTVKRQLEVYRQAVLTVAFNGIDDWVEMDALAVMIDPQPSHRTPAEVADGVPYIGIGDIDYENQCICFDDARKVAESVLIEHRVRYKIKPGDFIMGKIGTIGKPFRLPMPQDYTLSANVILIQPRLEKIIPEFLFWQFASPQVTRQLSLGATATSQPAFGIKKARELKIGICNFEKQEKILYSIQEKMSVCDSIEKTVDTALQQAEAMRQSILKQAFEGRL